MMKSWKTWSIVVGAIVATIVLIEKSQPYIESYSTRSTNAKLENLAANQYKMKHEILARLDRLEESMSEKKYEMDKDLIREIVTAVQESKLANSR